ncbi:hypothetical protein N9Z13_08100, partial [Luminiphilus sp.]|nr:hypothetical protein [Luminiphilus sp.]
MSDSNNFINSDFGQGHQTITLSCFADEEVKAWGGEAGVKAELVDSVLDLSGGLPELTEVLLQLAIECSKRAQLEESSRQTVKELCGRIFKWLDAPNSNEFLKHLSNLHLQLNPEASLNALNAHDWGKLLISRDGRLKSKALGAAACNELGLGISDTFGSIRSAIENGRDDNLEILLTNISFSQKKEPPMPEVIALAKLWLLTRPTTPSWKRIYDECTEKLKLISKSKSPSQEHTTSILTAWTDFANVMSKYAQESSGDSKGVSLSQ